MKHMPDTVTVTIGATDKVLPMISEGNYSSEFLLRESDQEFRMKVRHSKEKAVGGATPLDRHNVELTIRTFPTADLPLGRTESVYAVIRSDPNSDGSTAAVIARGLGSFVVDKRAELIAWQAGTD
jgi:hypothetical protein